MAIYTSKTPITYRLPTREHTDLWHRGYHLAKSLYEEEGKKSTN